MNTASNCTFDFLKNCTFRVRYCAYLLPVLSLVFTINFTASSQKVVGKIVDGKPVITMNID